MKLMNINACWIRSFSVIRMCCAAPACSRSDLPLAFRESMLRLFNKIEEVVREHASDSHDNQDDIDEADPVKDAGAGVAADYDVDGPSRKILPGSGVAAAAGGRKIRLVNCRGWIGRWFDIVDTMTTGAVGYLDRSGSAGEAVIAVLKRVKLLRRHSILFTEPDRIVAGRADLYGDVLRSHK